MSTPVIGTGVLTRGCLAEMLSLSSGQSTTAPLGTVVIHLLANPVAPTLDTPLASLSECTFDGYAAATATFSGPSVDLAGDTVLTPTVVPNSAVMAPSLLTRSMAGTQPVRERWPVYRLWARSLLSCPASVRRLL